jgi:hypothetical protein
MTKRRKRWALLMPWATQYAALYCDLEEHVKALSDADLLALGAEAEEPDQTNCWWATYDVASIVRDAVKLETYQRSQRVETEGSNDSE